MSGKPAIAPEPAAESTPSLIAGRYFRRSCSWFGASSRVTDGFTDFGSGRNSTSTWPYRTFSPAFTVYRSSAFALAWIASL